MSRVGYIQTTAIPMTCAACGLPIQVPGIYYGIVSHDPNDNKVYHAICFATRTKESDSGRD